MNLWGNFNTMEVFQHCLPVGDVHAGYVGAVTDKQLDDLDFTDQFSMAEVFHRLFDCIACVNTSTPIAARVSGGNDLNDSGFDDSFSSNLTDPHLSNLYLNESAFNEYEACGEEFPCPKMCLMSKLDEFESDEIADCLVNNKYNSDVSSTSICSGEDREIYCSPAMVLEMRLGLAIPDTTDGEVLTYQSPPRDRPSSARRFRSPAPVMERRSRHRLSLDSYTECCDQESYCDSQASVLYENGLPNKCDVASESHQVVPASYTDNICSLVHLTLAEFAPPSLGQLIGRKMGLDTVDIFSELMNRSMNIVVEKILDFVSAADLCRLCMVNRTWQAAVHNTRRSYSRKEIYVRHQCSKLSMQKQNVPVVQECQHNSLAKVNKMLRVPLLDVQPASGICEVVIDCKPPSLAHRFWQEAGKLRHDERLAKCPRCAGPSRVNSTQERATCTDLACKFDFCTCCMSAFHGASNCPSAYRPARRSEPCVGSRQSHRNLRRL